jgi:hypothetical protein
MEKETILYIGRNVEILNTVVRLINANADWLGFGALDDDTAKSLAKEQSFDVVLLGSGISDESEFSLRSFFAKENANTIIVQHYGGGSGLLLSEITTALVELNKKRECYSS